MPVRNNLSEIKGAGLVFAIALFIWWAFVTNFTFFLPLLNYPLYGSGDGSDFYLPSTSAKIFADNESLPFFLIQTPRLGAPFGFSFGDFPTPDGIMHLETWLISRFIRNPFAIMNLLYIFSFGLCAASFYWVSGHHLKNKIIRAGSALLFTFLPFHFGRFWHTFFANYFLVPWMLGYILQFWNTALDPLKTLLKPKNLFLLFLFGSSGGYYLYFFCILLGALTLYRFFLARYLSVFRNLVTIYAVVGFFFFLNLAPTLYFQKTHGKNETPVKRLRKEVIFFSLKPTNLIFPNQNNRITPLQELGKQSTKFGAKAGREGYGESLGLLGAFGMFASLFFFFRRRDKNQPLKLVGFLVLASLLSFSTGGFVCHLSIWLFPFFRSINRASVFIAFLSFLGLAIFFERWVYHGNQRKRMAFVILLFLFGIYEIIPLHTAIATYNPRAESNFNFYKELEEKTLAGSNILQLPFISFPEGQGYQLFGNYSHLAGFLQTKKLRFSFGLYRGRPEHDQVQNMSNQPLDFQAIEKNYQGILVERQAYSDNGKAIEDEIGRKYQITPLVSKNREKSFFSLPNPHR